MNRWASLVVCLAASAFACAEFDDPEVVVIGLAELNEDCEPADTGVYVGALEPIVVDVSLTDEVVVYPVLENRRPSDGTSPSCMSGPGCRSWALEIFTIHAAEFTWAHDDRVGGPQRVLVDGAVDPNGALFVAELSVPVPVDLGVQGTDERVETEIDAMIIGSFYDGTGYHEARVTVPIELCSGCLADVPESELCSGRRR